MDWNLTYCFRAKASPGSMLPYLKKDKKESENRSILDSTDVDELATGNYLISIVRALPSSATVVILAGMTVAIMKLNFLGPGL